MKKSLLPFLAAISGISNATPAIADSNYSQQIIANWDNEARKINSNEFISTSYDKKTKEKHQIYVNTSNKVYVYVSDVDNKLKMLSNDYRIVQSVADHINADEMLLKNFIKKPNIVMKKVHTSVPFEIIPVITPEGSSTTIIPGNPLNIEQAYKIEAHTKSFTTVALSTTCCATGTCDGTCRQCHDF